MGDRRVAEDVGLATVAVRRACGARLARLRCVDVAEVPMGALRRSIGRAIVLVANARVANIPVLECDEPLVDLRVLLRVDSRRTDAAGAFAHVRSGVARGSRSRR